LILIITHNFGSISIYRKMKKNNILLILLLFVVTTFSYPCMAKTFSDAMGRNVELEKPPQRIVPLAPSLTEILYFLGLGDKVVGVTKFSYYPPEAMDKPKIGSYIDLNAERIISLSPDIVIGTVDGNKPGVVEVLEQTGIPVYIVNPRNVHQVIDTIVEIGELCGIPEKATLKAQKLRDRVSFVQECVKSLEKPLVFLQINLKPIMTVNKNTFHQDLITLAGGRNMTENEPITYPRISREEVIRKKPDVIIISSMERAGGFERTKKDWQEWTSIPAVRNNRVFLINSDLTDRPSPRIVDGLEEMAKLIHPEVEWE
jgi:iron complex transport system substrate-binding protein